MPESRVARAAAGGARVKLMHSSPPAVHPRLPEVPVTRRPHATLPPSPCPCPCSDSAGGADVPSCMPRTACANASGISRFGSEWVCKGFPFSEGPEGGVGVGGCLGVALLRRRIPKHFPNCFSKL